MSNINRLNELETHTHWFDVEKKTEKRIEECDPGWKPISTIDLYFIKS